MQEEDGEAIRKALADLPLADLVLFLVLPHVSQEGKRVVSAAERQALLLSLKDVNKAQLAFRNLYCRGNYIYCGSLFFVLALKVLDEDMILAFFEPIDSLLWLDPDLTNAS